MHKLDDVYRTGYGHNIELCTKSPSQTRVAFIEPSVRMGHLRYVPEEFQSNQLPLIHYLNPPLLVTASVFPFIHPVAHPNPGSRILTYFLGFGTCFVILSISVEGLFYLSYSTTLVLWIEVEAIIRPPPKGTKDGHDSKPAILSHHFRPDDMRIALFFLFFVQVAFFGTGKWVALCCTSEFLRACAHDNLRSVASISSVYLSMTH